MSQVQVWHRYMAAVPHSQLDGVTHEYVSSYLVYLPTLIWRGNL